jgi:hypothetical protein
MRADLVELSFILLPDEDDWPPFAVEALWCHREGANFRVLTCPLFVKGVAVGDLIGATVECEPASPTLLEVRSFEVLEASDHSTIWMFADDAKLREMLRSRLHEVGCSTEGGPAGAPGLVAIDVPGGLNLGQLDELLQPFCENERIEVVYPALRHAEPTGR